MIKKIEAQRLEQRKKNEEDEKKVKLINDILSNAKAKFELSLKNQKKEIHADKVYTKCLRCGKPLKTLESQICGYGKVCKDKVSKSKKLRKKSFIGRNVYGTDSRTTRFGGEKH